MSANNVLVCLPGVVVNSNSSCTIFEYASTSSCATNLCIPGGGDGGGGGGVGGEGGNGPVQENG